LNKGDDMLVAKGKKKGRLNRLISIIFIFSFSFLIFSSFAQATDTISIGDIPDPVSPGENITYTIDVYVETGMEWGYVESWLDNHVEYVDSTPKGSYDSAYHTVTWDGLSLPAGLWTATLIVKVKSDTTGGTLIDNNCELRDEGGVRATGTTTTTVAQPKLNLMKQDSPDPVLAGSNIVYNIIYSNTGDADATGVNLVDDIPDNTEYVTCSGGGNFDPVHNRVIWSWNRVPKGEGGVVSLTVKVDSSTPDGTLIQNSTTITCSEQAQASALAKTTVVSLPELNLTKSDSPDPVQAGSSLTYTLNYSNTGNATATSVRLTDDLPSQVSYESSTPSGEYDGETHRLIWYPLDDLPPGEEETITVNVNVQFPLVSGTVLTNLASIDCAEQPQVQASEDTTVSSQPILSLTKSDSPDPVQAGSSLTYTLNYSNSGNANATGISLVDDLPSEVDYLSSTPPGTYDQQEHRVAWSLGTLSSGQEGTAVVNVLVHSPLASGTTLTNSAIISCCEGATKGVSENTDVSSEPILSLTKSDLPDPVQAGSSLTYTLTYSNSGNANATGVEIVDTLPSLDYIENVSSTPPGTYDSGKLTWNFNSLPAESTGTITIDVDVKSPLASGTTLTNSAKINCFEGVEGLVSINTDVSSEPILSLTKSDSPDPVQAGSSLTYTLNYSNSGNANATEVILIDNLPLEVDYVSSSSPGVYHGDEHQITWSLGTLPSGQEGTKVVNVLVHSPLASGTTLTNSATISCYVVSGVSTEVSEDTRVTGAPYLELTLSSDTTLVKRCDTVTYSITYRNAGDQDATNVIIEVEIPQHTTYIVGSGGDKASLSSDGNSIIWNIGSLKHKKTGERLNFKLQVNGVIPLGITQMSTYATIDCNELEPATSNIVTLRTVAPCFSIIKVAGRGEVELGDFLTYTIRIGNTSLDDEINDIRIIDKLPPGFNYVDGTTLIDGASAQNPVDEEGKKIWTLSQPLGPDSTLDLSYKIVVSVGAKIGENVNVARVEGTLSIPEEPSVSISAGPATAVVKVVRGIFSDRGRIIGKVYIDTNNNEAQDKGEVGAEGITLILEDGTQVVTDMYGMFSIPALPPGDHILSIDKNTLPEDLTVVSREFQHIYLAKGLTAKINFRLKEQE